MTLQYRESRRKLCSSKAIKEGNDPALPVLTTTTTILTEAYWTILQALIRLIYLICRQLHRYKYLVGYLLFSAIYTFAK